MSKNDIPGDDLAADAALAVEHTPERAADQLAHLGGELDDDVDGFDAAGLDDGSVLPDDYDPLNPAPAASQSDEETGEEATDEEADDEVVEDAPDAEAEEEPEAEAEESDDEEEPAKPPKGIPKHRFDEVNERRKAAEEELARLQAQMEAGKPPEEAEEVYNIRDNEKEYMDLLLDGDTEAALAKREEIDAAKYASWKAETQSATKTELSSEAETQELVAMSKEAEQMFDVFNPDSDNYNQPMLDKVMVFMRGYEGEMNRSDAFVAALADVVEMYDLMPDSDGEADSSSPKPTGKAKVDPKKAKLKEKAHVPVGGEGQGSAVAGAVVPSIEDMSDEELDALPEKTLARMRGDIL